MRKELSELFKNSEVTESQKIDYMNHLKSNYVEV